MSNTMYQTITNKIDAAHDDLKTLALSLHEHPELAFQEHFACKSLSAILEKYGYQVKTNIAGMETAFIGELRGKDGGRTAISGEASGVPDVSEGCPFRQRCRYCTEVCRTERPRLRTVEEGHQVACHLEFREKRRMEKRRLE